MNALVAALRERIVAGGPISLAEYMQACLTHPEHGYYVTRDPLGRAGDFTTSPEISQLFGELIGLWLVERWLGLGAPSRFHLIEPGPGRGTLMADALRAAKIRPAFLQAMQLHLVEASPALREKQKILLGASRITHHASLASIPTDAPWLLVANEFFDALPIRQFSRREDGWHERLVGWREEEGFVWAETSEPSALEGEGEEGAIRETCEPARAIMRQVATQLAANDGAALIVDYGGRGGRGDTFQAVAQHGYADPFAHPGEADLTAHVDFTELAEAAQVAGLQAALTDQGRWLRGLGGELLLKRHLASASPQQAKALRSGWQRIADPMGMGGLFKVLEISA